MPPWLKEKWIEWLGPERIYELYGGTEAQGATIISGVEWLEHRGSVGKIGETARLRIIGEDGNEVATGETGEIYFLPNDGAGSTYHYLGAEPKRRADGWESLGDIGRLDAEGYLYLGDRLADMILRGGANIYPAEVEAAVTEHPEVRSCVVVGLPDPEFGQRVHAILELDASAMRRPLPTAWPRSWPTGSAATSIRKVLRPLPSACATIPARSAGRCCATNAPAG
jgi:bile acid-coenzyme A ligase